MDYRTFKQVMRSFFTTQGFSSHGDHFYKDTGDEILIVFGLQKSNYGDWCYLESGYCLKAINPFLPYPRHNQANINCGRLRTEDGSKLEYLQMEGTELPDAVKGMILAQAEVMQQVARNGPDMIRQVYFINKEIPFSYILGKETAYFFGMDPADFQYHICL